jgi:CcmD family protein
MITMPSLRRAFAAFLVSLCACALPAVAQSQQSDPALPPKPPPPLTAPDRGDARAVEEKLRENMDAAEEKLRESRDAAEEKLPEPPRTDEFVPISELPPDEQLPAAPMLIAAYLFVVLALFGYLLSVSRRLGSVKQEIARLEAETRRSGQR